MPILLHFCIYIFPKLRVYILQGFPPSFPSLTLLLPGLLPPLPFRLLPPPSTTTTSSSTAASSTSFLANLPAPSLIRSCHLPSPNAPSLPLYPRSYSLNLSLGTPPQSVSLVLNTSTDLLWVPFTTSYLCRNCPFPHPPHPFLPYTSSSSKPVRCRNPKCIACPDEVGYCFLSRGFDGISRVHSSLVLGGGAASRLS